MLRAGGLAGVVQADMGVLPLRSRALDGIWCQAAMLHVTRTQVPQVLGEFACVTRSGAALYLAVSEGYGEGWEVGEYGGGARWSVHHRLPGLTGLLGAAGFTVVEVVRRAGNRQWLASTDDHAGGIAVVKAQ